MGRRIRELMLVAAVCGVAGWGLHAPVRRMFVLDPAMRQAVEKGDVAAVRRLALAGAGVNNRVPHRIPGLPESSPLTVAISAMDADTVALLIRRGADVHYADQRGVTPLIQAAEWGEVNVVAELLRAGARVDATTRDGETVLHRAVQSWSSEPVVRLLLQHGADPHALHDHLTPLALAEERGNRRSAALLRKTGAANREACFHRIAAQGPLAAVRSGHLGAVKLLVRRGVSFRVRDDEGTTITAAALDWSGRMLPYLMKHARGIDRGFLYERCDDGNALTVAACRALDGNTRILIAAGVDPNVPRGGDGYTALHSMAGGGIPQMVTALLKAGAKIDAKDDYGRTPLDCARRNGHTQVVTLLLKAGAR